MLGCIVVVVIIINIHICRWWASECAWARTGAVDSAVAWGGSFIAIVVATRALGVGMEVRRRLAG
jgi:steroid 5-alpha reductase family enzyme